MSDMAVFIYLCFFVALFGATFAFMFKSMTAIYQMDKPIKRRVHPEMDEVETGTELLVFRGIEDEEDEEEEDDDGDILVVRKCLLVCKYRLKIFRQNFDPFSFLVTSVTRRTRRT